MQRRGCPRGYADIGWSSSLLAVVELAPSNICFTSENRGRRPYGGGEGKMSAAPIPRGGTRKEKKQQSTVQNKTQEVLTYAFYNLTGQNGEAPVAIIVKINQLHVVSARYVPEAVCTAKRRAARRPRAAQAGTHLLMHRRAWLAWGARALFVAQPQALGSVGREDGCACSSDF